VRSYHQHHTATARNPQKVYPNLGLGSLQMQTLEACSAEHGVGDLTISPQGKALSMFADRKRDRTVGFCVSLSPLLRGLSLNSPNCLWGSLQELVCSDRITGARLWLAGPNRSRCFGKIHLGASRAASNPGHHSFLRNQLEALPDQSRSCFQITPTTTKPKPVWNDFTNPRERLRASLAGDDGTHAKATSEAVHRLVAIGVKVKK
jgi:hypothetical protein